MEKIELSTMYGKMKNKKLEGSVNVNNKVVSIGQVIIIKNEMSVYDIVEVANIFKSPFNGEILLKVKPLNSKYCDIISTDKILAKLVQVEDDFNDYFKRK